MKISRKHLLYIIDKLSKISNEIKEEYEIDNSTFSDQREFMDNNSLMNRPYALKAKSKREAEILYPYFNETGKSSNGNYTHQFEVGMNNHSDYYCLFKGKDYQSVAVHESQIGSDDYKEFAILRFEDVKEDIERFLNAKGIVY